MEPHDCFAALPAVQAARLADEIDRVKACTTMGEVRRLAPLLKETRALLGHVESEEAEDDDPFDWEDAGDTQDGDWPRGPTAAVLDRESEFLVDDLVARAGAERAHTMFNGAYLETPRDCEQNLLAVMGPPRSARMR